MSKGQDPALYGIIRPLSEEFFDFLLGRRLGPDPVSTALPLKRFAFWVGWFGITTVVFVVFADGIKQKGSVGIWFVTQRLTVYWIAGNP